MKLGRNGGKLKKHCENNTSPRKIQKNEYSDLTNCELKEITRQEL